MVWASAASPRLRTRYGLVRAGCAPAAPGRRDGPWP